MSVLIRPVEKTAVWAHCLLASPECTLVFVQEPQSKKTPKLDCIDCCPLNHLREDIVWTGEYASGEQAMLLFLRCIYLLILACKLKGSKEAWDQGWVFPFLALDLSFLSQGGLCSVTTVSVCKALVISLLQSLIVAFTF